MEIQKAKRSEKKKERVVGDYFEIVPPDATALQNGLIQNLELYLRDLPQWHPRFKDIFRGKWGKYKERDHRRFYQNLLVREGKGKLHFLSSMQVDPQARDRYSTISFAPMGNPELLRAIQPDDEIDTCLRRWTKCADKNVIQNAFFRFIMKWAGKVLRPSQLGKTSRLELSLKDYERIKKLIMKFIAKETSPKKPPPVFSLWPPLQFVCEYVIERLKLKEKELKSERKAPQRHRPSDQDFNQLIVALADHLKAKTGHYYWADIGELLYHKFPTLIQTPDPLNVKSRYKTEKQRAKREEEMSKD